MKKLFNFLRSMRFGLLLLGLLAALAVIGSLIPQDQAADWYAAAYPNAHTAILALGLDRVYSRWYFVLLLGLLGLNLIFCSLLRIVALVRSEGRFTASAAALPNEAELAPEALRQLEEQLQRRGCRREDFGGARVYSKNRAGRYGSFITHLAILLTLLFGAAALYLPQVTDLDCMPGESVALPGKAGGTARFAVHEFRMTDESGRLDYTSLLTVTLPDGRQRSGEIKVNHPMSFGPYKVYQQTAGMAGSVTVTNLENMGSDVFFLTELSFLSLDNYSGLWFVALYPDYTYNALGQLMPMNTGDMSYPRPVYYVQTVEGEERDMLLLQPGDTVELGQLRFAFNDPVAYPGCASNTPPRWSTPC